MKFHLCQPDYDGKDWFWHLQIAHVCLMLEHKVRLKLRDMPANFDIVSANWLACYRDHYDFAKAQSTMPLP